MRYGLSVFVEVDEDALEYARTDKDNPWRKWVYYSTHGPDKWNIGDHALTEGDLTVEMVIKSLCTMWNKYGTTELYTRVGNGQTFRRKVLAEIKIERS